MAIGEFRGRTIAVVFKRLGSEAISVISMRRARSGEFMAKPSRIRPISDEEKAEIQREIASDPDAPEATDEELAQAKPFAEAFPDLAESIRRSRGRPPVTDPKLPVTIRLDRDVVEKFKATGKGWQGRINEVLKRAKV